jgi:hypothetical protein
MLNGAFSPIHFTHQWNHTPTVMPLKDLKDVSKMKIKSEFNVKNVVNERCTVACPLHIFPSLNFKLSPYSECRMLYSGWFTSVWSLYANVSQNTAPSSKASSAGSIHFKVYLQTGDTITAVLHQAENKELFIKITRHHLIFICLCVTIIMRNGLATPCPCIRLIANCLIQLVLQQGGNLEFLYSSCLPYFNTELTGTKSDPLQQNLDDLFTRYASRAI